MLLENEIDENALQLRARLSDDDVAILLFLQELKEASHCEHLRVIPGGRWAGVIRYMSTWGILVGRLWNLDTYDDRWCFSTEKKATGALCAWDGVGEPTGWHRHPLSGRRRPHGDPAQEYIHY